MVNELKVYDSVNELVKALHDKINLTKTMLGEYLRRMDEIRGVAERSKKVQDVVTKLAGKKADVASALGEVTVGDLSVVLDAKPFQELTAMEEVVRSHQDRLLVLQKAYDGMKWANELEESEGLKIMVLERDGVPERILLKFS